MSVGRINNFQTLWSSRELDSRSVLYRSTGIQRFQIPGHSLSFSAPARMRPARSSFRSAQSFVIKAIKLATIIISVVLSLQLFVWSKQASMSSTCVACRGPKDEAESFCQGCTEALSAIVTQEEDDQHIAASSAEGPSSPSPPVQQQQHGELCPACRDPLPHPSLTLCPGCLEAARYCVSESAFPILRDGAVALANDGHNHHHKSDPAAATSAATPRRRPVADAAIGEWTPSPNGDAVTTITVKSPGRLIRERFLAACAQGEVVELLLSQESPSASSSSSECVIVDVRPARSSNSPITRRQVSQTTGSIAASLATQEPSTTNRAAQSTSRCNHDSCSHNDNDDDDCRIVGVKSNSEQIHERLRQAAASGQVINLMTTTTTSMRQSNRGPQEQEQEAAATANNEMTKHRTKSMNTCAQQQKTTSSGHLIIIRTHQHQKQSASGSLAPESSTG